MPSAGVTELLLEWSQGNKAALNRLMPLVYEELRLVARNHLYREDAGHTLPSTAIVHEAYLRLVNQDRVQWRNRAHFFAVASQMIRRILVDHARERDAQKRGSGRPRLELQEAVAMANRRDVDILALDDALLELERLDAEQAHVVELRFFGGLTIPEAAEAIGASASTVQRHWTTAKAWLFDQLAHADGAGGRYDA